MTRTPLTVCALVAASTASAQLTTTVFDGGDDGFNFFTFDGALEQGVIESRIGNAGPDAGVWELGLWRRGAVGAPLDTEGRPISNGVTVDFSITYDGSTGLSGTFAGASVEGTIGGSFTDIFIRNRGVANGTVTLDELQIDGVGLDVPSLVTIDGVEYLRIVVTGGGVFDGFTLSGTQTFEWTGSRPNNSALATQFKFTNTVIPTPGTAALLGVAGLAATRRRR